MKKLLVILYVIFSYVSSAQKQYGFDQATLISTSSMALNDYRGGMLQVDEHKNKFYFNRFIGDVYLGSDTLSSIYSNPQQSTSCAISIAQFDSNNNYVKSAKLAEGEGIQGSSMRYHHHHFYIMISYTGKLMLDGDSLQTNNYGDICLLKLDSNFHVLSKLNIGSHFGEMVSSQAFTLVNGHLYFAGNFNIGDSTLSAYDNYKLAINTDTIACDTGSNNSGADFFVCEMDLDFNVIKVKAMGGALNNGCYALAVLDNNVYIMGYTSCPVGNNIGGIVFSYNFSIYANDFYFVAKLDEQLNGVWVRKFG